MATDKRALRRAKLKRAALLRAAFNAQTALERIDYKLDVIDPALEELEALPDNKLPEIKGIKGIKDA